MPRLFPPVRSKTGAALVEDGSIGYQLTPFIEGSPLPRPHYIADAWRGEVLADLLRDLAAAGSRIEASKLPGFAILSYVDNLMAAIKSHRSCLHGVITPHRNWLAENLAPKLVAIPTAFCHGDVHPVNVIWEDDDIAALIDWEFCGPKPEIHDLANLLGCIGSEDPDALGGPLVESLLRGTIGVGLYSEAGISALLPFVVAIRFAWLSEWLRKSDEAMIEQEMAYLDILTSHADDIQHLWESARA